MGCIRFSCITFDIPTSDFKYKKKSYQLLVKDSSFISSSSSYMQRAKKELPAYPFIVVANHISWLDIFVLLSVLPVSFIAKIEIKKWFFLGNLVEMAGTIFIDRNRRKSIRKLRRKLLKNL